MFEKFECWTRPGMTYMTNRKEIVTVDIRGIFLILNKPHLQIIYFSTYILYFEYFFVGLHKIIKENSKTTL